MTDWLIGLPTWQLARIFGIASYLLLFGGMALGMLYGYPFVKGAMKATVYKFHLRLTNGGTVLALAHAAILLIDTYTPFTWQEVLIPFTSENHPFLFGIGTLSLYGMLLLLFTSDFRQLLSRKLWLSIHLLSYPIFLLALVHGFFGGTDSGLPAIKYMYGATLAVTLLLACGRGLVRKAGPHGGRLQTSKRARSL
ncbi:ferric reductase [Paenibacillus sp. N4]|uniref:ferric reductase n=1 Tax=Paenibacillus vietnamensis TaxID=2590547 RepID=UPI001CD15122|nr:ferric reductase [Paenibacillus vietnamensis]MCA0756160.1 ferric reductase [Paenibacillus vietnamensis]